MMSDISKPACGESRHPWGEFLRARARCLVWLRDEQGETPERICKTLRMDPEQVRLILASEDATR